MATALGPNWAWDRYRQTHYYPRWHSFPNVSLWAIAWFQGGP